MLTLLPCTCVTLISAQFTGSFSVYHYRSISLQEYGVSDDGVRNAFATPQAICLLTHGQDASALVPPMPDLFYSIDEYV